MGRPLTLPPSMIESIDPLLGTWSFASTSWQGKPLIPNDHRVPLLWTKGHYNFFVQSLDESLGIDPSDLDVLLGTNPISLGRQASGYPLIKPKILITDYILDEFKPFFNLLAENGIQVIPNNFRIRQKVEIDGDGNPVFTFYESGLLDLALPIIDYSDEFEFTADDVVDYPTVPPPDTYVPTSKFDGTIKIKSPVYNITDWRGGQVLHILSTRSGVIITAPEILREDIHHNITDYEDPDFALAGPFNGSFGGSELALNLLQNPDAFDLTTINDQATNAAKAAFPLYDKFKCVLLFERFAGTTTTVKEPFDPPDNNINNLILSEDSDVSVVEAFCADLVDFNFEYGGINEYYSTQFGGGTPTIFNGGSPDELLSIIRGYVNDFFGLNLQ